MVNDLVPPQQPIQPQQQIQPPGDHEKESENAENHQEELVPIMPQPRRNPSRVRLPPSRLQEYVTYAPRHPLGQAVFSNQVTSTHFAFLKKLSHETEPRTFEEASQSSIWRKAMDDELRALNANKTWSIVKLPKG